MWRTLSSVFSRGKTYDVLINLTINGQDIVGPIDGQSLAIIAKYGSYRPDEDILKLTYPYDRLQMTIKYIER
jgi:hypothetical protein